MVSLWRATLSPIPLQPERRKLSRRGPKVFGRAAFSLRRIRWFARRWEVNDRASQVNAVDEDAFVTRANERCPLDRGWPYRLTRRAENVMQRTNRLIMLVLGCLPSAYLSLHLCGTSETSSVK
jgi:hypothetical protein